MGIYEIVFILSLIALDQLTKVIATNSLALTGSIELIRGFFHLTYAQNTGAAWSIFQGAGALFVLVAAAASIYLLYYLSRNRSLNRLERTALILIVSGAIANMIDRIVHGYVIDFLDFYIFGYDFPVFNIADCCLTIGVGLYIIDVLFVHKES